MRLLASGAALLAGIGLTAVSPMATQREVEAVIEIAASPQLVWRILTDFPSYPVWNPYIYPIRLRGALRPGAQLEVTLHPGHQTISFLPTILAVDPGRELRWGGQLIATSVFGRVQTFTIEPIGVTRTRLISREVFTGLLIPFYGAMVGQTQRGLEMMNRTLRTRAELLTPLRGPADAPARTGPAGQGAWRGSPKQPYGDSAQGGGTCSSRSSSSPSSRGCWARSWAWAEASSSSRASRSSSACRSATRSGRASSR